MDKSLGIPVWVGAVVVALSLAICGGKCVIGREGRTRKKRQLSQLVLPPRPKGQVLRVDSAQIQGAVGELPITHLIGQNMAQKKSGKSGDPGGRLIGNLPAHKHTHASM